MAGHVEQEVTGIMTTEQIRQLTNIIYRALFDMDAAALRIHFGLPPCSDDDVTDDDIRDCMGIEALEELSFIEDVLATAILNEPARFKSYKTVTRTLAQDRARKAKAKAVSAGIELLTGKRLKM